MSALKAMTDGREAGVWAMARDAALMDALRVAGNDAPVLRSHGWSHATLTIGRVQEPPARLVDEAREAGVELVRRPTGGGWLLHLPGDLSITFALPGPLRAGQLRGAAATLGRGIAHGLRMLGHDADFVVTPAGSGVGCEAICFDRIDREEVSVEGTKVAGVALARIARSALVQSALPVTPAPPELVAFTARWDPQREDACHRLARVDAFELARTVQESVARQLGREVQVISWPASWLARAEKMKAMRSADFAFPCPDRDTESQSA